MLVPWSQTQNLAFSIQHVSLWNGMGHIGVCCYGYSHRNSLCTYCHHVFVLIIDYHSDLRLIPRSPLLATFVAHSAKCAEKTKVKFHTQG